jgi:hypothetical protein
MIITEVSPPLSPSLSPSLSLSYLGGNEQVCRAYPWHTLMTSWLGLSREKQISRNAKGEVSLEKIDLSSQSQSK